MGTAFYLTYGVSKFLSGVLVTVPNPRYFMGIGFNDDGIVNILFNMSSSVFMFITLMDDQRLSKVGVGLHVQNPEYLVLT